MRKTFLSAIGLLLLVSCTTVKPPAPAPQPVPNPMPPMPSLSPISANVVLHSRMNDMLVSPQFPTAPDNNHWVTLTLGHQPVSYAIYQRSSLAPGAAWTPVTNTTCTQIDLGLNTSGSMAFYKALATILPMQSIGFQWNAEISTNVAGYKIYYGGVSRAYTNSFLVGLIPSTTVSNLPAGSTFYFSVTAYNALMQESDYSDEVVYATPTNAKAFTISIDAFPKVPTVATLAATNVTATSAVLQGQVLDTGKDLPATLFFYGMTDPYWDTNTEWSSFIPSGTSTNTASVLLSNLTPNTHYYFSFSALNAAGAGQSPTSSSFTTLPSP